jgi:hypothetical protein
VTVYAAGVPHNVELGRQRVRVQAHNLMAGQCLGLVTGACCQCTKCACHLNLSILPHDAHPQLSVLDHAAVLGCINPRALGYSYRIDPLAMRAALSATLARIPCLAGRLVPDSAHQRCLAQPQQHRGGDARIGSTDGVAEALQHYSDSTTVTRAWKPPAWWRTPLGVSAVALDHVRRTQAYCMVLCNAGVCMRAVLTL